MYHFHCVMFYVPAGLDVATCGVASLTSFYTVATKLIFTHGANLAPKIADFLLWENVH